MAAPRRNAIAILGVIAFAVFVTVIGLIGAGTITIGGLTATTAPPTTQVDPLERFVETESAAVASASQSLGVSVPATPGQPAPAWPATPWRTPLPSHVVVGFVPWYELSASASPGSAPASDFSQLVYHALSVRGDGSLDETVGPSNGGYDDLANGGAAALVARGHGAGAQVLLGLATASPSVVNALCSHPAGAGRTMAAAAVPLLEHGSFDGVDIDIEGQATSDRPGFVRLMRSFSGALRRVDPSWVIMLNTYPNSASDPTSFYDVRALAPYTSEFFVMAYDMNDFETPSATAPLQGIDVSDAVTMATYASAGLARKVVLGVPFYGYDFAASSKVPAIADTIGQPTAVTYASIVKVGRPALWDPASDTPYSVFRRDHHWHQTWFDDPVSIGLKTGLASYFHARGVGCWELGMAAGQPEIVDAMLGGSPPVHLPMARNPSS